MAKQPVEQIAEATTEAVTKSGEAAEKIVKGSAEALTDGNASRTAVQELATAYQELAKKNAKNLTTAMQALAAVKSSTEFVELQQRLITEGVAAAVSDSTLPIDHRRIHRRLRAREKTDRGGARKSAQT